MPISGATTIPAPYNPHRRVAVVFDFDDTLMPDSASALFRAHQVDTDRLWKIEAPALTKRGYDPSLAWLKLVLDRIGDTKPLGLLSRANLRSFGASLEPKLFPGLTTLPMDLKAIGKGFDWRVDLYVVSGGLEDVIRGVPFIRSNFTEVYGSLLEDDGHPPRLSSIMRSISFTEKTRYLFEINKGITAKETLEVPYAVNEEIKHERRPVPLDCMIYVGDGLTDIPCFSLLTEYDGYPFGVFDPGREREAKTAFQKLLMPRRTLGVHSPRYGPEDDLGFLIRQSVKDICGRASVGHLGPSPRS